MKIGSVIIDTNLLLDDEFIIHKLAEEYDKVVIPTTVLKEIDQLKRNPNLRYPARRAIREILRFKDKNPDRLIFLMNDSDVSTNDEKIIEATVSCDGTLLTKDVSMHLLATSKGVSSNLYNHDDVDGFDPYYHIEFNDEVFCQAGESVFSFHQSYIGNAYHAIVAVFEKVSKRSIDKDSWFFVIISSCDELYVYANNPKVHKLVRIDNDPNYKSIAVDKGIKLKALDIYQNCAIYALREAEHVLITGKWGSGKSLLATAYSLADSGKGGSSKKIFITRPNKGITSEFDIGFRPGDLYDKMVDWCGGFISALYFIYSNTRGQVKKAASYDFIKDEIFKNVFEIMQIDSIQGVSMLSGDILMVDEVQLISVDYLSMILSRMSEGSKLILLGDLAQTYSAIRMAESGLRKLIQNLPDKSLAYVNLQNSYRSKITKLAEKLQNP